MLHITQPNPESTAIKLEGTIDVNITEGDLYSLLDRLIDTAYHHFKIADKEFSQRDNQ